MSVRRAFTDDERASIETLTKSRPSSVMMSLFTMISGKEASRLVFVKAVDEHYPLYGSVRIDDSKDMGPIPSQALYAEPQLLSQIGLKIGDFLKIGKSQFQIKGLITDDGAQSVRFSALAPKVYISLSDLKKTELIGLGSTLTETHLFKVSNTPELKKLSVDLDKRLPDSAVSIKTATEAASDSVRALKYLADYLGLISLVGFLLSVLGAGFLFSRYLQEQMRMVAILNSLGLQKTKALFFLALQSLILATAAAILCLVLSYPLQQGLSVLLTEVLQTKIQIHMTLNSFLFTFLISVIGSVLIIAPYFQQILKLNPKVLLENVEKLPSGSSKISTVILTAVCLAAIWLTSLYISKSLKLSTYFTLGICLLGAAIGALSHFAIRLLAKWPMDSWKRVAVWDMKGKSISQGILISVISLSILLIDSVHQIENSIQNQLTMQDDSSLPSFFLFDIQDEQVEPLNKSVAALGLSVLQPAPMVRAKLISINQKSFERNLESDRFETREEEEESRFRNRGLNLSYRAHLEEGETLTSGTALSKEYSGEGPIELSLEEDYAQRLGVRLGDILEFNVQGLDFKGEVKNFRRVNWARFLPNFFVIAQPGFLESAPKTWLAGLSKGSTQQLSEAQHSLATTFPNISLVDLDQVIKKIREITSQMSLALQFTAFLVLIAGIFILFAMSRYHLHQSQKDLNLLKVLGATPGFISKKLGFEYLALTVFCWILGSAGSFLVSSLILDRIFEAPLVWNYSTSLILLAGLSVIGLIMTIIANLWAQNSEPKDLLG